MKKGRPKKGLVVKPIISEDRNSRCQIDLIDLQSCPADEYKFILVYQVLILNILDRKNEFVFEIFNISEGADIEEKSKFVGINMALISAIWHMALISAIFGRGRWLQPLTLIFLHKSAPLSFIVL